LGYGSIGAVTSPRLLPIRPLHELRERVSEKWRAYPPDVLPLTVAEMDVDLADAVSTVLDQALARSDTGYAMPYPELGKALSAFADQRWGWAVDPDQVTAVTDVGVGVVETLRLLVRPGDPVAFSPPVYPPFFDWVPESGGRIVEVPLALTDDGWRLDLDAIERAFAQHPAAYVLCNPHNPVGRVHTADELADLVRLARLYRVPIVSDEIHAPLVLPGATFTPLLSVPGASEIAVAVQSASKAFNLAGLKCAAIVTASIRMRDLIARMPSDSRWRIGHFGVLATVAAYRDGGEWLDRLLATLDARRSLLGDLVRERLEPLRWHPPEATFLAWLDCRAIGIDSVARDLFLEKGRVALEPGLAFGAAGSGFVRLNFATSAEIIDQATRGMANSLLQM
jgi:cystathionine beta-lyase